MKLVLKSCYSWTIHSTQYSVYRCKGILLPSTCPVYPGSVAIQFPFHLLLAA